MRKRLKDKRAKVNSKKNFTCQHCGYNGPGWTKGGYECPKCHKSYNAQMAQDNEDQP